VVSPISGDDSETGLIESAQEPNSAQSDTRFALGLRDDYDAVRAGLTLDHSNGQVEGQVTRLKLVRRSMYGRGRFDVLEHRVLPAA